MKRSVLKLPVKTVLPELDFGVVTCAGEAGLHVELDGIEYPATAALSCLVQPIAGDSVLCVTGGR